MPTAANIGLGNVDNTSDVNKPVSTATATALAGKASTGLISSSGLTAATSRLLGRVTAGIGVIEEIELGTNLSFSGNTLNASGGGGAPGGSSGQLQWNNSGSFAGLSTTAVDGSGNLTFTARWIQSTNGAASAPAFTLTGTWFTGGITSTTKPQFLIEPAGTTSNNWSTAGTGLGVNAASGFTGNLLDLQVNGSRKIRFDQTGKIWGDGSNAHLELTDAGGCALRYGPAIGPIGTVFVGFSLRLQSNDGVSFCDANNQITAKLTAEGNNQLAQRNGTAPQVFRVYNTYTSATNNELAKLSWSSNVFQLGTEKGSAGGTARAMELQTDGTARIRIGAAGELGFFGAAAVAQPAAVADATDNASAITQLNLALARLRSLGLLAT